MTRFYLTIDDGPSKDTANKLKFFEEKNVSAVWFCIGENLEKYPEVTKQLICKGHIIGNHSYNHPYFSKANLEECKAQIKRTELIIEESYRRANRIRPAKLFRFPHGEQGHFENGRPSYCPDKIAHNTQIQQFLKDLKFNSAPVADIEYDSVYANKPGD